jgi:tRNA pseudouridine55 synthase
MQALSGVVVIDKPGGMTSFAVVKRVRQGLGVRKAGHTGTLDPMATGVLPVCVGEATKIAALLTAGDKVYTGTALLGLETDTLDITGNVVKQKGAEGLARGRISEVVAELVGPQLQVPPAFSAVRSGGERAYARARRGEEVDLEPREIVVRRFELTGWDHPRFELLVECSKGTYVRSLVAEVGRRLGCGATLTALRRLRSGPFGLEQAVALADLDRVAAGELELVSPDRALSHLPAVELRRREVDRVTHGQPVERPRGELPPVSEQLRMRFEGELVALGEVRGGKVWPKRVLRR